MKRQHVASMVIASASIFVVGVTLAAQDKYTVQVPGGLAFSEFRGYEDWQAVSVSQTEERLKVILANPAMVEAYRAGVPGNGQPFPDGAKMAKIEWKPKANAESPFPVNVPDTLDGIGFMEKDTERFPDSGGWGYAQFRYDPASDAYTPHEEYVGDAKCGHACHTIVEAKDYVFTAYQKR
jgi:Cytochrome P460